ncbi:MAG TPA: PAS domain S-box protein [Jatrophihabitantaceae bacterium]|nr:PAS domain S-box protein [Jatrophihabitantaceae bacterium]
MIATTPSVILIDDVFEVRMLLRSALRISGRYDVVAEGSNGEEAIELAKLNRPDVLVLDMSMPVMDGLEALPRILEVSPQTRVVVYTGFDERGLAEQARALGAAGFLQKSTSLDAFVSDLDDLLAADLSGLEPVPDALPDADLAAQLSGVSIDILNEHLERFREVFEEATIGMATMTLTGRLVRANRALARLVGRSIDDLIGVPYIALTDGLSDETMHAALTAHIDGADVVQVEHDARVGGALRRFAATIAVARDSKLRPLYLFVQVQDISAQRRAEEALRTSEERFGMLVDAVEDYAIFMLDPDGYVVSWNSGAQRAKGYSAEEIIGQHFRTFYPPQQQAAKHPEHELEIAKAEGHYEEEGWRVRKDGSTFWANVLISAVRDSTGRHVGFAKVTRDITERRAMLERQEAARQALADANSQLEEANRRLAQAAAEQAQFVAVTSHELRNPISVLAGASAMLVNSWEDLTADERSEMFESITTSSARLSRLLADLLTSSRLESGAMELHLQPVTLAPLLERVASTTARSFPAAELKVECPPEIVLEADSDRLTQAIENLALNGVRHGSGTVLLAAGAWADRIEITVSDEGEGVPAVLLPRLFERFVTGRRPGGTGLGLFIVRELVRAHGGDVRYVPGDRPAFVITLPTRAVAAQ